MKVYGTDVNASNPVEETGVSELREATLVVSVEDLKMISEFFTACYDEGRMVGAARRLAPAPEAAPRPAPVASNRDAPLLRIAVPGLDLTLAPGEAVALTGPSGAGKTELLLRIAGLGPGQGLELFGERPYAEVVIGEVDGVPQGFALFFHNFSTFEGKPGIYLEDLFVRPEARGAGLGKALLAHLAQLCVERDCARLEWSVLDWNAPAIGFYRSLGARMMDEWTVMRVDGDALPALAQAATSAA